MLHQVRNINLIILVLMKHYPLNKIIYENNKNKIRKDSLIKKKKKIHINKYNREVA